MGKYIKLDSEKNVRRFSEQVNKIWKIDAEIISTVVGKYPKIVERYSPEHYGLYYEMITEKIKGMTEVEKLSYIASKKVNYKHLNDTKVLSYLLTFFTGSIFPTLATEDIITGLLLVAIYILLLVIYLFSLSSMKPRFYSELIANIEKGQSNY